MLKEKLIKRLELLIKTLARIIIDILVSKIEDLVLAYHNIKQLVSFLNRLFQFINISKEFWTIILGESRRLKVAKILVVIVPCIIAYLLNETPGYWASGTLFGGVLIYNVIEADKRRD